MPLIVIIISQKMTADKFQKYAPKHSMFIFLKFFLNKGLALPFGTYPKRAAKSIIPFWFYQHFNPSLSPARENFQNLLKYLHLNFSRKIFLNLQPYTCFVTVHSDCSCKLSQIVIYSIFVYKDSISSNK